MANYRPVYVQIWEGQDFADYESLKQLIFLYLITNEKCSLSGIYKITMKQIGSSVNLDRKKTESIVRSFPKKQVEYDFNTGIVFVKNFFKFNLSTIGNPTTINASLIANRKLINHPYWNEFIDIYGGDIALINSRVKNDKYIISKEFFHTETSLSPDLYNNKDNNNNKDQNKNKDPKTEIKKIKSSSYPDRFEKIWRAYDFPVDNKGSKSKAFDSWNRNAKNSLDDDVLIQAIGRYKRSKKVADGFIQHFVTWLNGKNWEAYLEAKEKIEKREQAIQRQDEQYKSELMTKKDEDAHYRKHQNIDRKGGMTAVSEILNNLKNGGKSNAS